MTAELPAHWADADELQEAPKPRKRTPRKAAPKPVTETQAKPAPKTQARAAPRVTQKATEPWEDLRMAVNVETGHGFVTTIANLRSDDAQTHTITKFVRAPMVTTSAEKLVVFPIAAHCFPGTGVKYTTCVGFDKPYDFDVEDIPGAIAAMGGAASLNLVTDKTDVRRYMVQKKTTVDPEGGSTDAFYVLVGNDVDVETVGARFDIADGRVLKPAGALCMTVVNRRDRGTVRAPVYYQDLAKQAGQADWYSTTLLGVNVEKVNLNHVADMLRTIAVNAPEVNYVNGLGPVNLVDGRRVFIAGSWTLDTRTGARLDNFAVTDADNAITSFGVTPTDDRDQVAAGYVNLGRFLDTCPPRPGVPAAMLGAVATAGLAPVDKRYRVVLYVHGRPGSGKTSLGFLLLAMQSPTARGYNDVTPTVSMRKGPGGTTGNGSNMSLQYAGGFLPLVDDFVQLQSLPKDVLERQGVLNVMLGDKISKQNWGKAGPELARVYRLQGSAVVSAERPVTMGSEGLLRRIVELETPDVSWGQPGGVDHRLIRELDSKPVMDTMHAAWSDALVWLATHEGEAETLLVQALQDVNEWDEVPNESIRGSYATLITGLRIVAQRAKVYGVDLDTRVDVAVKDLREQAARQVALIGGRGDFRATVLGFLREQAFDGRITFVGEPEGLVNVEKGGPDRPWSDPFFVPIPKKGDDDTDPDEDADADAEQKAVRYANPLGIDHTRAGFRYLNNAWTASQVVGYLKLPRKGGRPSSYASGYVWMTGDQVDALRRAMVRANLVDDSDARAFRARLIAEKVAVDKRPDGRPMRDGGPNSVAIRSIRIAAEDIWPANTEEGE